MSPDPGLLIRPLRVDDIDIIAAAFAALGWNKPAAQYRRYLDEQQAGQRQVFVACAAGEFAGYLTVLWHSHYPPFAAAGIPEIADFNVLPHLRRHGIGSSLMDAAEACIADRSSLAGIGVGLLADYGAAQRLYARRGYLPDGRGLAYHGEPVAYGSLARVDDDLCLYFTKNLRP